MFLVTRAAHAQHNAVLRDRGDGVSKKITDAGTVFLEAPNDPDVVVRKLTEREAADLVAKLKEGERKASLSSLAKKVKDAEVALAENAKALEALAAHAEKLHLELRAAQKSLADAEAALTPPSAKKKES